MNTPKPWLPYVVPFGVYMVFLSLQSQWPAMLTWIYPAKTLAVAAALWVFRDKYDELRTPQCCSGAEDSALHRSATTTVLLAVVVGLVAIIIWIGIDPYYPGVGEAMTRFEAWANRLFGYREPQWTPPVPFDPHTLGAATRMWSFIVVRTVGAVLVVPLMEELFWRAFLIRWLVKEDFKSVPVGTFTWASFAITVAFFGAEHNEWLAGLICGALYNWLYYRTKSVGACVIAHAVSNAALAAWVLARGDWKFW